MSQASPEIRIATSNETEQTIATVVAAFITDPFCRFAWPSPHQYFEGMPVTVRAFAGAAFEHGSAFVSADFCGAGLWLPPGAHPDDASLEKALRETVEPGSLDDFLGTFEQMDQAHPEERHWYLPLIGVEPAAQGRGLGGALMRHATERFDEEGVLAYLESSNPRNISLYERHGFEVLGEIRVGKAPVVTPMLRRPR